MIKRSIINISNEGGDNPMKSIISILILAVIVYVVFFKNRDGETSNRKRNKRNSEDTIYMPPKKAKIVNMIETIKRNIRF